MKKFEGFGKLMTHLVIGVLLVTSYSAHADRRECFSKVTLSAISMGEVNDAKNGDDHRSSVVIVTSNGVEHSLNYLQNLNDDKGQLLISTLNMALALGYKVTGWDHHGEKCDDFDEIRVEL